MSQVDPIERLLAAARDELGPTETDLARSRLALGLPQKAPPNSRAGDTPPASHSSSILPIVSGKAGLIAGALLIGASLAALHWTARIGREAPSEAVAPAQRAPEVALPPKESEIAPVPVVSLAEHVAQVGGGPASTSEAAPSMAARIPSSAALDRPPKQTPPKGTAKDELLLLRRVDRALRAEDWALALILLGELRQRFPNTDLVEERAAATVLAQCGSVVRGARQLAENYLRDRPGSVYAERIRAGCRVVSTPGKARESSSPAGGKK